MNKYLLILTVFSISFLSCKKSKKAEETSEVVNSEEIIYTSENIKVMFDSTVTLANSTWDSVTIYDDNKMANIKRLLDEISYCDNADDKKLKELYKVFEEVQALRYNQDNITNEMIDLYDSAQNVLINESNSLAEITPNIESHPLAIELIDEIIKVDGMTFSKRGDYDIWAKQINNALKNHPELVKELGTPYTNYNKLGIFGFED